MQNFGFRTITCEYKVTCMVFECIIWISSSSSIMMIFSILQRNNFNIWTYTVILASGDLWPTAFYYYYPLANEVAKGYSNATVRKNLPSDLDLWPWKSIGFQTLLRTKYVPSLVKIHWRMLILECSQGWANSLLLLLSPRQRSCEGI
jgi:hypothetical protein